MRNPLYLGLASGFLALNTVCGSLLVHSKELSNLIPRLEKALNKSDHSSLRTLLESRNGLDQVRRYSNFMKKYPNALWTVEQSIPRKDGPPTFQIAVTAIKESGPHNYFLESKQLVTFQAKDGKIIDQELISEQSILKSSIKPLPITILIPDQVLTGSRYDIDIVFDEPLGGALVAAGLINISPEQVKNQVIPPIVLSPMGGGGLFKSVKAPLKEGIQTWVALLAHTDGLISVTKKVKVVSD